MGLKNVNVTGRLVRDPETRSTNAGMSICNFTVAVDSNRPPKNGEKGKASFFRVVVFGKRGEVCQQYLLKGQEVSVSGDIELDTYEAQDGKAHANMQITADHVHFGKKVESAPKRESQNDFARDHDSVY